MLYILDNSLNYTNSFKHRKEQKVMDIPPSELIDRITIVRLKIERIKDSSAKNEFKKEFKACKNALRAFKKQGGKLKRKWFDELYEINKNQWNLESEMSNAQKVKDLKSMGKTYIEIQKSNKKRVAVKNKIAEETGEGFQDIKIN